MAETGMTGAAVRTQIIGTTQMHTHNIRLANPDDPFARAIAQISSKRKKTEEDRREMARLEWHGGLYTELGMAYTPDLMEQEGIQLVIPQHNLKRCYKETAKATRRGRTIDRALNPLFPDAALVLPLQYGPVDANGNLMGVPDGKGGKIAPMHTRTLEDLRLIPGYSDITMVTVSGRVPRCRPTFFPWAQTADWLVFPSLLDLREFKDITGMAGLIEGFNDNRINGAGRFAVEFSVWDGARWNADLDKALITDDLMSLTLSVKGEL